MVRSLYLIFLSTFLIAVAQAQMKPFKVMGTLVNMPDVHTIRYSYLGRVDTVQVVNGKYTITGKIEGAGTINIGADGMDYYELFIVPGDIYARSVGEFENTVVSGTGGKWDKDYHYILTQEQLSKEAGTKFSVDATNLYTKTVMYKRGNKTLYPNEAAYLKDSVRVVKMYDTIDVVLPERLYHKVFIPYIKAHPGSPVSIIALTKMAPRDITDLPTMNKWFDYLSPEVKELPEAKNLKKRLDLKNKTTAGKIAAEITLPDTLHNKVSLSSFKGKYVLLDFWADWCAPCRREFPYMKKVYDTYKEKGLAIISVSVNRNTDLKKWKTALRIEQTPWCNVFDFQGEASKAYSILAIPRNFLIDPYGLIIATDLFGDELEKKLKEVFGK